MLLRLLVLACFAISFSPLLAKDRPNLVFILADDLGYGDLGCYGCPDIQTPNLDRLANEGVLFTDFYANGPVCSPTRIAFLTGRYQQRFGMENALTYQEMGRGLPEDGKTIADFLQAAGYTTGLSGKWHLGYDHERKPLQQGFNHFFGLLSGNHHYFEHMDRIGVPDLWRGNQAITEEGYTTDLITEDALAFLEKNQDQRFFLYLSHAAPHFPWQGPDDIEKVVEPKKKTWQQGDRETYVAMVERMDFGIGQVLKKLDELELRDQTLVVFSSDNGGHTWSRNAPLRDYKGTLYEGGIRVPCIARWPGVLAANTTCSEPAITMDWSATFTRLGGCEVDPSAGDGVDLMPVLLSEKSLEERPLFWRRKNGPRRKNLDEGRTVRLGEWKLFEPVDGEAALFNLQRDISETRNLIKSRPKLALQLSEMLDAWEADVDQQTETTP
ncbi:Twin-arginine translocation pathway signal [Planctomycetales bacterium 10988]|nr:Twin-arginine translocation pathway signal [Planctomycetales bacterium 10988]